MLITGGICRNQESERHWDEELNNEDDHPVGLHVVERMGTAMSKNRQWISFVRNHCVWALLEGGKKPGVMLKFNRTCALFFLVCNK
jgi:hypothetical protein